MKASKGTLLTRVGPFSVVQDQRDSVSYIVVCRQLPPEGRRDEAIAIHIETILNRAYRAELAASKRKEKV